MVTTSENRPASKNAEARFAAGDGNPQNAADSNGKTESDDTPARNKDRVRNQQAPK